MLVQSFAQSDLTIYGSVRQLRYITSTPRCICIQRGNAVSVLGTFASEECLAFEDINIFYLCLCVLLIT